MDKKRSAKRKKKVITMCKMFIVAKRHYAIYTIRYAKSKNEKNNFSLKPKSNHLKRFSMKRSNLKHMMVALCYLLSIQTAWTQSRGTWEKKTLMEEFPCITEVENKWNSLGDIVRLHFDTNCDKAPPLTPENLLTDYKDLLVLGEHDSLVLTKAHDSEVRRLRGGGDYDGQYVYEQYYKGYPVDGGGIKLNLYQNKVRMLVDGIRKVDMDINPLVTVEEAACLVDSMLVMESPYHILVPVAEKDIGMYAWVEPYLYRYFKEATLVEYQRNEYYVLNYTFQAIGIHPYVHYTISVNPMTEKVSILPTLQLHDSPCLTSCDFSGDIPIDNCTNGSSTVYDAVDYAACTFTQDVATFPTYGNDVSGANSCQSMIMHYCFSPPPSKPKMYRLSRIDLPHINVYHGSISSPTTYSDYVVFPDEADLDIPLQPYQFKDDILSGVSAYWGVDVAEDYFQNFPNYLNSFDNANSPINIVVNHPFMTNNAEWFRDSPIPNFIILSTFEEASLQTMAHEYTHGILYNSYNITNLGGTTIAGLETLALHEGLADIFAIMTDRYAFNNGIISSWSWNYGNNRFLNDPSTSVISISGTNYQQADTYKGAYWNTHLNPPMEQMQYIASGVPCYWFYLLSEGGSDTNDKGDAYTVTGIGVVNAERILVEGLKKLDAAGLEANRAAKFGHLREYTISAAGDLFGDCSTEVIETMNAWYAVGVGANEPELWMQDGANDIGLEPNEYRFVYDGSGNVINEDIWTSPDLWNRLEVGITNFNTIDKTHQQPEQDEVGGIDNSLLVEVHNTSTCSSPAAEVKLYWTIASTGEIWDGDVEANNDWINATYTGGGNTCLVGDEIGTITIPSDDIPLGETRKYGLEWTPPSQTELESCDVPYDENNPGKFEICFLARLLSTNDPLMGEQNGANSTKNNVINFNNVVTRNTFILPVTGGGLPPEENDVRYLFIKNTDHFFNHLDITYESIGDEQECAEDVNIDLILPDPLWTKWESTGFQGDSIAILEPGIVRVTDCSKAVLKNIPFDAYERQSIGLRATTVSGKTTFAAPINYSFKISHQSTNPHIDITPPTACVFKLEQQGNIAEHQTPAKEFTLRAYPNPFTHHIVLDYELPQAATVSIQLYDIQGRQVATIASAVYQESGKQTVYFDGNNLAKGIYLCAIRVDNKVFTQKIVKMD